MATYYIHPQLGSNSNDGLSSGAPKASPPTLSNGDVLKFARGSVYNASSQWSWGTNTGITLEDYGTGELPIISITAASTNAINIQGDGTHIIRNIHFKNFTTNSGGGAIGLGLVAATSKCAVAKITDCKFTNISHNAIRLGNSNTADTSPTFYCSRCEFFNIGEDCIFGGALVYEVSYCKANKISTNTGNGDFVGFLQADPTFVWVHHNYIDHSSVWSKQCIIVDSSTGAGLAIIEYNTCIGSGGWSGDMGPDPDGASTATHTVINVDCPAIIRANLIYASTIAIYTTGAGTVINGNIIFATNGKTTRPLISLSANTCRVYNNSIIGTLPNIKGIYAVVQASGTSSHEVKNNIFVNVEIAVKSNQAASNPTCSNNNFYNVTTKYQISTAEDFSGTNDVLENPRFDSGYIPQNTSLFTAGTFLGGTDYYLKSFVNPPPIGATQNFTSRDIANGNLTL